MRPAVVYRLAAWRQSPPLGPGRTVLLAHGPGFARLRYHDPAGEDRTRCAERQAWMLDVVRRCGGTRGTVAEDACLARGAAACEYTVAWTDGPPTARAALAALAVAIALAPMPLSPFAWGLVPVAGLTVWIVERGRGRRAGRAEPATGFEWLLARARDIPAEPAASAEPAAESDGGVPVVASSAASVDGPAAGGDGAPVLEQVGQLWRISYQGTTVMLRHSRGLALLVHLVRYAGRDIHVRDLDAITPSGGSPVAREAPAPDDSFVPGAGDAGEVLDEQAREEYRHRITELRAELDDAEARHDLGRVAVVRAELDALAEQLRAAVGPRGRVRRASADVERLRVAITRRIRAAIEQIGKHHPALGAHLAASVSTGYHCAYAPGRAVSPTPDEP